MTHFQLSPLELTRTRFAFSPLWETMMSFEVMHYPDQYPIHLPWIGEAKDAMADLELPLMQLFLRDVRRRCYIPDFLTPPPTTPLPDFADELRRMLEAPAHIVQREMQKTFQDQALPNAATIFFDDPKSALERLGAEVQTFWERALEPHWPRLCAMLENDVLTRGRTLALGGAEALFKDLNPSVRYRDGLLEVGDSSKVEEIHLDGRGLLLMPSAFVWPIYQVILDEPWQPTIAYTPRGVANLWCSEPPPVAQSLELLLGKGRAEVLLSLEPPSSTLEIAKRLGLVPSSVSEHLGLLRQAGLVEAQRRGRFVYYRLSRTGSALLEVLGKPTEQSTEQSDSLEVV
jgi:DNA-binding transcriptional ArsR family regulator